MARNNYQYEKRQKDIARKKKQDEKRQKKLSKRADGTEDVSGNNTENPEIDQVVKE